MSEDRRYKEPLTAVEKMRLMRVITMTRAAILQAAQFEEELGGLGNPTAQREYVAAHRRVYNQLDLHHQFPFLEIRTDSYMSDLLKELEKDMTFYVKEGDTRGGP